MLHLNEELKTLGTKLHWICIFMPELYRAVTLRDFLDEKHLIKPTRKLIPPSVFVYGCGVVLLPNLLYTPVDDKIGRLSDLESSVLVHISDWFLTTEDRELLQDSLRLYEPFVLYNPRKDKSYLYGFERHCPQDVDPSTKRSYFFDIFRKSPSLGIEGT